MFEIARGGSVYQEGVGSDSFSEPGWLIEAGRSKFTEGETDDLVGLVAEYLNLGAEITVADESEIEFD